MERKEINILDYFILLFQARWYIFGIFFLVCALAAGFSYLLPVYYQSSSVLLPPSEGDQGFGFSQALSMLPVNIRLGSSGSPSDIYIGVMSSQSVELAMIEKFNLMEVYGSKTRDEAMKTLEGLSTFTITKHGLISVKVQDTDPERAAAMVNFYSTMLDSINRKVSQRSSEESAGFLREQIERNRIALDEAENDLKEFQERTSVMSPYHQQRVALSLSAELEADIMSMEGQLEELRARSMTDANSLVQDLLKSIRVREDQLDEIEYGREDGGRSLFVPLREAPDLLVEYTRLARRVELLSQLEEILMQQYEEQNIQRVNDSPTVEVLDPGLVPQRKYRPKRSLIVVIAGAMWLFFAILSVIFIEFVNQLTELTPVNKAKVERLARFMRIQS